jgi:sulfonate transport system substrate-binding protein
VALWARAAEWVRAHPDEFADLYYVKDQGLTQSDARYVVSVGGDADIPRDWSTAVGLEQAAADVMARQTGRPPLAADSLFDHRFASVAADAADAEWAKESGAPVAHLASADARRTTP